MGESRPAVSVTRTSARTSAPVQRFDPADRYGLRGSDRSLFDVCRFRPRPSGFLYHRRAKGFHAPATPLCELPVSSKCYHPSTAPACACESTSPAVSSPTTLDRNRRPYHPEIPTSGTVRPQGFSPSRRLASPVTLAGLFHPACVPGVPPDPTARQRLSTLAGRCRFRVSSSRLSPPP